MKGLKSGFVLLFEVFCFVLLYVIAILYRSRVRNKIVFGSTPILNNKYWVRALKEGGVEAISLMATYYPLINDKQDYDLYFDDLVPNWVPLRIRTIAFSLFTWLYLIRNASVIAMPFEGFSFGEVFWRCEYYLCKISKIKIIILPYGSDVYMYSRIADKSLQNALLISYPEAARRERLVTARVNFWSEKADCVLAGFMAADGLPRWDITIPQYIQIDTREWKCKTEYSNNDGINGPVKIIHTPNHRGFKGTEYLLKAVEELKNEEDLKIELILLEKVANKKVKELMQSADILAEQFIFTGYALSGMEGMASGLPVMSNLESECYTELYHRYSFLGECPVFSTKPETIKNNLRRLILEPKLRYELGCAGRAYAEKYHSIEMSQHLFTNILGKLHGESIDLMNLYHPLKSEYVINNPIDNPIYNEVKNK